MSQGKRRAGVVVALAMAALFAAACGGGTHHPAGSAAGPGQITAQSLATFARCMRSHGLPNFYFSRSGSSNLGTSTTPTIGIRGWVAPADPGSPHFQPAMKACNHLFPGGPPPPITQRQKERMLQFAACLRAHGYPSYPDPQFPAGGGVTQQQPPGIDPNSPQFQAAEKACNAKP